MAKIERLDTEALAEQLRALEREVGLPAAEFYDRYRAGEMGDSPTATHWAGICYMAVRRGILADRPVQRQHA